MDYMGIARTNYFKVRDVDAFRKWAKPYDLKVITSHLDPLVFALIIETEDAFIDPDDLENNNFAIELASHLAPDAVAILIEIGHEDTEYLTGHAMAINATGRRIDLDLNTIYEMAQNAFPQAKITYAEY